MPESGPSKPSNLSEMIDAVAPTKDETSSSTALALGGAARRDESNSSIIQVKKGPAIPRPEWQRPWKLMRVISGHTGWVRCIDVDASNEWFVTSGNDMMIKLWDLASGTLKLTLTG